MHSCGMGGGGGGSVCDHCDSIGMAERVNVTTFMDTITVIKVKVSTAVVRILYMYDLVPLIPSPFLKVGPIDLSHERGVSLVRYAPCQWDVWLPFNRGECPVISLDDY